MIVRGRIRTMDPERPLADAMAVVGGRIAAVGSLDEARSAVGDHVPVHDLGDATVLPGLVDAHNHMLWTGLQSRLVNLGPARSIAEALDAVARWAAEHPDAPWVVGAEGWHVDAFAERRYPTAAELDGVCPDRPVYLGRGGHAAATNSAALRLAGIDADTPDPAGGVIVRAEDGRTPTGVLLEGPARELVTVHIPALSDPERRAALASIQPRYLAAGLVRVQEPGLTEAELGLYQDVHADGELAVRVTAMPLFGGGDREVAEALERVPGLGVRTGFGDDRLRLGGVKAYFDGAASFGTAYLREDWPQRPGYRGELVTRPETLEAVAEWCARERWSLGVHTVGGGAIDLALEAFDRVHRRHPVDGLRFTLIHAYVWPSEANLRDARRLGVVIATQPTMQEQFGPGLVEVFGSEAIARATPLRTWLDAGVHVAGGSDSPITPFEPLRGIWQAATRYAADVGGPLGPGERITPEEAVALYTTAGAFAAFAEGANGVLRAGRPADWIALGGDPIGGDPMEIADLPVLATAVDGELLHEA